MKMIKFKASDVLPSVVQLAQLCNNKNIIRMFDYLRFETENGMNITGSDGETWMSLNVPLFTPTDEKLAFCIDSQKLTLGLRSLGDAIVELELNDESHIATFKYNNGQFELPYLDASEYPMSSDVPNGKLVSLQINSKDLFSGINTTEFAVDNDELRPQMCGIHVDFIADEQGKKELVFVATDTRKLVRFKENIMFDDCAIGCGFTIPKKPSSVISNYLSMSNLTDGDGMAMNVEFDDSKFTISNHVMKMSTRLANGRYPNYDAVLPEYPNDKVVVIARDAFISALRRVSAFGNQKTQMVVLTFENNIVEISASDVDYSTRAKETFPCEYNGEMVQIGFTCSAFVDVIKNVKSENVRIKLISGQRAAMVLPDEQVENTDYVSIQMPMMIHEL
jgi:DNA polymerase-3 subunit beta